MWGFGWESSLINKKCNACAKCSNSEYTCQGPRTATRQLDHFVILTSLGDRTATASSIRTQLWTASIVKVSNQTICNWLNEADLQLKGLAVWPCLTQANHTVCLALAWCHLPSTGQQWSRVLFTDESQFTLSFMVHPVLQLWKNSSLEMSGRVLPRCHCEGAQSWCRVASGCKTEHTSAYPMDPDWQWQFANCHGFLPC